MKLGKFDIVKICGYVIGFGSLITAQTVVAFGVSQSAATHIVTIIGFLVALATLIANTIKTATPDGTQIARIPLQSVPVVTAALGTGTPSVATASAAGLGAVGSTQDWTKADARVHATIPAVTTPKGTP